MQNLWNGPSGRAWVESQELLDQVLEPFEKMLVSAVDAEKPKRVLDVGCGAGATTLAIARSVGSCTGVDISEPMIERARARAKGESTFILADAQTYAFEQGSFDMIVSRFGVMFFDDPVAAFANLRRAAKDGAALRVIVWRSPAENPFMTTAERAGARFFSLPERKPDEPGQFAFADRDRVQRILEASGWSNVAIEPFDVPCSFPATELVRYTTRMGPVGRALQEADEATRAQVIEALRAAFEPYVHGDDVRFTSACFVVSARA